MTVTLPEQQLPDSQRWYVRRGTMTTLWIAGRTNGCKQDGPMF